jgi:hypothetical protein
MRLVQIYESQQLHHATVPLRCSVRNFSAQTHVLGLLEKLAIKLWRLSLQLVSYGITYEVSRIDMRIPLAELRNQLSRLHGNSRRNNPRLLTFHSNNLQVHNRKQQLSEKRHKRWVLEVLLMQEVRF